MSSEMPDRVVSVATWRESAILVVFRDAEPGRQPLPTQGARVSTPCSMAALRPHDAADIALGAHQQVRRRDA